MFLITKFKIVLYFVQYQLKNTININIIITILYYVHTEE